MFEEVSHASAVFEAAAVVESRIANACPASGGALTLTDLLQAKPGPDLGALLADLDPDRLSEELRIEALQAWSRQLAWTHAGMTRSIRAVAGPNVALISGGHTITDPGREEVAVALRISPSAAAVQVHTARKLCGPHRGTLQALSDGSLSYQGARMLVDVCEGLETEQILQVEARVLPSAGRRELSQLRRTARRAVAGLAMHVFEDSNRAARSVRRVTVEHQPDGLATFSALLPVADAYLLYDTVDARARVIADEERRAAAAGLPADTDVTLDQRRADALMEIAHSGFEAATAVSSRAGKGESAGRDPHGPMRRAAVILDLPTALGLADNPGEIPGYGPVPADVARQIAADAHWVRWIVDPVSGELVDVGRRTYRPSEQMRDFIMARDRVCRFPGCNQPAHRNDIDHAVPWDSGGESIRSNLGSLCRRHHRMKSCGLWQLVESQADGSCTWRGPSKQWARQQAEPPLRAEPSQPVESDCADPPPF